MTDHETEVDKAKVTKKAAPPAGKSAPVLPWMRVPITIGGEGIALDKISGLPSTLASAIKKREPVHANSQSPQIVFKFSLNVMI